MIDIKKLQWDSNFFELSVFQIRIIGKFDLLELKTTLQDARIDTAYIMLENPNDSSIYAIGTIANFIEMKVVFSKIIREETYQFNSNVTRYDQAITDELIELSLISGQNSRFNIDLNFRTYFEKLYKHWIEKSVSGVLSDIVFVNKIDGKLTGFVTISKMNNVGRIGLIGVHPDFQRRGVGSSLIDATHAWYKQQGCTRGEVTTQKSNQKACSFYKKSGYSFKAETAIFHYWKPMHNS